MKKKILSALLALTLSSSMFAQTALAVKMYAPDGRTASVAEVDVKSWKAVGWYDYPVTKMYAPDGRTAIIATTAVKDWKKVGWYDTKSITMYAADGRTKIVPISEIAYRKSVGWHENPVECTHNWKEATCYSPKKCTICGKTKGEAKGHSYSSDNGKCVFCGKEWLLYEHNGIKIYYRGNSAGYSGFDVKLEIINNSYKTERIQIREESVNGYMSDFIMSDDVSPGKRVYTDFTILDSSLNNIGIYDYDDIDELEFKFIFCNSDYFLSPTIGIYFE